MGEVAYLTPDTHTFLSNPSPLHYYCYYGLLYDAI
jgi:hypothetical protein